MVQLFVRTPLLQKLAKSFCPKRESAVLDASSEIVALAPAIGSCDCNHRGHDQLRICFGHVLIHDLLDIEFQPMLRQNIAIALVLRICFREGVYVV